MFSVLAHQIKQGANRGHALSPDNLRLGLAIFHGPLCQWSLAIEKKEEYLRW